MNQLVPLALSNENRRDVKFVASCLHKFQGAGFMLNCKSVTSLWIWHLWPHSAKSYQGFHKRILVFTGREEFVSIKIKLFVGNLLQNEHLNLTCSPLHFPDCKIAKRIKRAFQEFRSLLQSSDKWSFGLFLQKMKMRLKSSYIKIRG